MNFILTNCSTGEQQQVTRECVDRVKGSFYIDQIIRKVMQNGGCIEVHFEGNYDLKVKNK